MDSGDERAPLLGGGVSEKRVKKRVEVEDNLTFRESSAENEQPASQTEFFVTMLPFIILQVLLLLLPFPIVSPSSDQHWALCLPTSHLLPPGGRQERIDPRPVWRRLWHHPPQPLRLWTPGWEVPPSLGRSCHLFCRISHRRRIIPSIWPSPMGGPQDDLLGNPLTSFQSHSNV